MMLKKNITITYLNVRSRIFDSIAGFPGDDAGVVRAG